VRLKLFCCEILFREICHLAARSSHQIDVEFLPKGLHDMGARMKDHLQERLDSISPGTYDAVLFGYALCGNGLAGLEARHTQFVVPRAHDCIALFLGSKERYLEMFQSHPGTYFKTSGWIERGQGLQPLDQRTMMGKDGAPTTYEGLVEKYGEENAQFLWEQLGGYTKHYSQFVYIEMGVEPDGRFERTVEQDAATRGWRYEKVRGDLSLLERLLEGKWDDEDFLVVPPGWRLAPRYDESIMGAEKIDS
jgi:hypothetical protein